MIEHAEPTFPHQFGNARLCLAPQWHRIAERGLAGRRQGHLAAAAILACRDDTDERRRSSGCSTRVSVVGSIISRSASAPTEISGLVERFRQHTKLRAGEIERRQHLVVDLRHPPRQLAQAKAHASRDLRG